MQISLRQRLILGTGLMLGPLILLGVLGYWLYLKTIVSFEEVMDQTLQVMMPVSELHREILQADLPINKHLMTDQDENRRTFSRLVLNIDADFEAVLSNRRVVTENRQAMLEARASWQRAKAIGVQIMEVRQAHQDSLMIDKAVRYERHIREANYKLDKAYQAISTIIEQRHQQALQTREQIQILLVLAFSAGIVVAILVGNGLARQIMSPLDKLRRGTERFGEGDLRYRIELENDDELGQLARTFNIMANELEFLASYDSLTGLLNKREFELRLNEELRRAKRRHHPFVLLLLDLDYFKNINDTYGHQAGDDALRVLAALLQKQVREIDHVARYGGEEFSIILTDTSEQDAYEIAERIRRLVETKKFLINENSYIQMTISIGMASYPDGAANGDVLISCADQALYKAKEEGRNQVVSFSNS